MNRNTNIKIKKSFTIFEVLISLILIGVVISSMPKVFKSNDSISTYYKLQKIENEFIKNNHISETSSIKFNTKLNSN